MVTAVVALMVANVIVTAAVVPAIVVPMPAMIVAVILPLPVMAPGVIGVARPKGLLTIAVAPPIIVARGTIIIASIIAATMMILRKRRAGRCYGQSRSYKHFAYHVLSSQRAPMIDRNVRLHRRDWPRAE